MLSTVSSPGQTPNRIAQQLATKKAQRSSSIIERIDLFDVQPQRSIHARNASVVERATMVTVRQKMSANIRRDLPELLDLTIPVEDTVLTLELFQQDPLSDGYRAVSSDGRVSEERGAHYRGILQGDVQSIASISVFDGEVVGVISSERYGNIVVGRWAPESTDHIIYKDRDLKIENMFNCHTPDEPQMQDVQEEATKQFDRSAAANCVQVYFETSYSLFQNKGSFSNVQSYVQGLFNVVSTIYSNDNMNVEISEIFVWTSSDPFNHSSSSTAMSSFQNTRPNFNGTLGHLLDLSGNGNGGLAWVGVLCSSSSNYAYSDIGTSYASFPTYSWTVNVVAHEMGHNYGSPHTHACRWGPQGNAALDDCATTEGGCAPGPDPGAAKGTIMSYCHLGGNPGISFNNGFGPEPGQLMRDRAASASCLPTCGSGGGGGCNLSISNVNVAHATCGKNNGQITVSVSGGTSGVTYDIGQGQQSSNFFNNLAPGNYVVTVRSGGSCTDTESANLIMESTAPGLSVTVTNATCGQSDGVIELSASGGESPYTYKVGSKTQSSPVFTNLSVGNYTATVIDDNGCKATKSASVFTDDPPRISTSLDHTSCGEDNGEVIITATGGDGPYTFMLDNQSSPNGQFKNVAPGTYTAEVIDNNGCVDDETVRINSSAAITISAEVVGTECGLPNGEITIDGDGGVGRLRYSIGAGFKFSNQFDDLAAATYTISIRDEASCLVSMQEVVSSSSSFTPTLSAQTTTCGLDNGALSISIEGTSGPYQYKLNNGAYKDESEFADLPSGTATVTIKDAAGCEVSEQANIGASTNPALQPVSDRTHCGLDNGTITAGVQGGIAPYQYSIGGQAQAQPSFEGLPSASYMLRVVDASGCEDSVSVTIDTSEAVAAQVATVATRCGYPNGQISLRATQGIGPFTYQVDQQLQSDTMFEGLAAGFRTYRVEDADGCTLVDSVWIDSSNAILLDAQVDMTSCGRDNGVIEILAEGGTGVLAYTLSDTFHAQYIYEALAPGDYLLKVRDDEDCIEEMTVSVLPSTNPILRFDQQHTRCGLPNGQIELGVQDGVGPYQYLVNGDTIPEAKAQALPPGFYTLQVVDVHRCFDTASTTIDPSTAPQLAFATDPASCYQENGTIEFSGSLGIAPYRYSIGGDFQADPVFEGVDSGSYQLVLLDEADCADTVVMAVAYDDQYQRPELADNSSICESEPATLDIGLTSPPSTMWYRDGTLLDETSTTLITAQPGQYEVVVTYHEECVLDDQTTLVVHQKPVQELASSDTICLGEDFEIAQVDPALQYEWSNDSVGTAVAFPFSSRYTLKVTNVHGCFITKDIDMEVIQPVVLTTASTELNLCPGLSLQIMVQGADRYAWQTDDPSIDRTDIAAPTVSPSEDATYQVVGLNQCFDDTLAVAVLVYEDQTTVTPDTLIIEGAPLQLFVEGASEVAWETGYEAECPECPDPVIRPELPGIARVAYTDDVGCAWTDSVQIDIIPLQDIFPPLVNVITPNNDGMNDELFFKGIDTFKAIQLEIFNQQGQVIHIDKMYDNDWQGNADGEDLPEGVYFYMITLLLDDRAFHFDSDLTIVRD